MYKLESISKNYGTLVVLDNFSLSIPKDRITVLVGPSGCGKTTLLNILAGLVRPDRGQVISEQVSYLFQEPRLLPWLNVRENIGLPLRDIFEKKRVDEEVRRYLREIGLEGYADFYPGQLSGGLKQRVAMARAFAFPAPILLMDEPFKSLDLKIRYRLMEDFIRLWLSEPRTVVAVTHDLHEAVVLGDRVILLDEKPARIKQCYEIAVPRDVRHESGEIRRLERELLELMLA
ncbi:MAG TPA: ABC transporter ATP-binding protein [Bacillota bacterium]|nr:ABC transporter ATP-binding protein [Bacillota bacterium]HPT86740.1 ABC transporter ATP-binding protein [Bacillota bacterium]